MSPEQDPLVGTELAGRFVIERVLGEGGLGRVYVARHRRMSRRYAIKVPYGELTHDPVSRARFLREADVTGRLEHPAVVAATDVGETETGLLYLAMDLAEGFGLDVVLQAGPMPGHRIPILIEQVLAGLAHAHERGVVHRDLKPANVIVDRDRLRIIDFGIAALTEDVAGTHTRLTTEGTIVGTPEYMAPEQLSARPVDARTDLFSLGVMLYEMLSGKLPFDGSPMQIGAQNMAADPPRIAVRAPEAGPVDPLIEALARWMMEKEPSMRPRTASDALAVLRLMRTDRVEATRVLAPWLDSERASIGNVSDSRETTRISGRSVPTPTVPPVPERAQVWAPTSASGTEPRRRGSTIALAALVAVPLVALGIWQITKTQPQPQPQLEPPAVAADVAPTTDVPPAAATVDRPPSTATRPPPAPTRSPPTATRPPPKPAVTKPAVTKPVLLPPSSAPSSETFTSRYKSVGTSLSAFRTSQGDDAVADLLERYSAIAYLDAVRKPDLRAAAMRELDAISRTLASRAAGKP